MGRERKLSARGSEPLPASLRCTDASHIHLRLVHLLQTELWQVSHDQLISVQLNPEWASLFLLDEYHRASTIDLHSLNTSQTRLI